MTSFLAIVIPSLRQQPGAARKLPASLPDTVIPGEATNLLFARNFDYFVACRHAI